MFWKMMGMFVSLVALLVASGCSELEDPASCPSGLICPPATICAASQDICISDPCGNGVIDTRAGEICDDGNIIARDGCSQDCKSDETCGNSVVDGPVGEACDDGNRTSGDGCSADCQSREMCGDGIVNEREGEQCDDNGNSESCDADCTAASCGDGFVNSVAGEHCDPPSQTCSKICQFINCGDGVKDPGEDCDTGGVNTNACDIDCTLPACGDGIHNAPAGEPCDDGGQDTTSCNGNCSRPQCGDSWWNAASGEQCDTAGNSTDCDEDCTLPHCGDQFLNPAAGETCDDGNLMNGDECTEVCEPADCSDGFQNADEIDVDCSGHCGSGSCEMLQSCSASEDCAAGVCLGGTCVPDRSRLVAGAIHTCARLHTGAARCWGHGSRGKLGYGNTHSIGDNESPAFAGSINLGGSVIQLTAGSEHTCALLDNGTVRCWGDGGDGQLGYGNTNDIGDNETPASAGNVHVGESVTQLATGYLYTCALLDTGDVRCWGSGLYGQLGYGNTNDIGDDEVPASAGNVHVGGDVIQLAAGDHHTCALLTTGAVRCWGNGHSGQLGYGNRSDIGDREAPASAGNVDVGGTVIQLAAGGLHTCALLDTGAVRCWGYGHYGQLGYGNTNSIGNDEVPASAGNVDVGGTVIQLAVGGRHTCALLDTGTVRCWGSGLYGQLGYGNTNTIGDDEIPASAGNVNIGGAAIQLAAGYSHTCALLDTGIVRCWGAGSYGQLGYGNTDIIGDDEEPDSAGNVDLGGSILQQAANSEHACDPLDITDTHGWSNGVHGQLDHGATSPIGYDQAPDSVDYIDSATHQGAASFEHAGALPDIDVTSCWSDALSSSLG